MAEQKEMPFEAVLTALFSGDEPPIHLLYRLSDLSDADFARLKKEWASVSVDRRAALARHMADIAESNYLVDFAPVFALMFADEAPAVRIAALDGVWDSEDTKLIRPITDLLQNDADVGVRAAAARALAHYVLLAEWGQINNVHTAPVVDALLAEYDKPRTAPEVRRATLEAVSPAGHPRIAELITDAYEDGTDELQLSAIFAMGNTADNRWLPILEQELASPSPDFRAEAARACGMIGDQSSIDVLEQVLADEDIEVGMAAIYALGQIGGDQAHAILSALADDPDYEEYYDAIDEALEEMEWLEGELDMLSFSDYEDDNDIPDDLRLN
jgi:HEAT repeat protein